jgi:CRP/FNR family transcriptional regulator
MLVSPHGAGVEAPSTPATLTPTATVKTHFAKSHCSRCHLRAWCMPGDPANARVDCMDSLMFSRRRIRAGERLYRTGETFSCLFEIRSGTLKSSLSTAHGKERVSAFHMAGELVGLDGIADGHHASSATALEDTEVCAASYAMVTALAESNASLQRTLLQELSRESVRELHLLVRFGSLSSERRLATFLLNLSQRLSARGYSPSEFRMRMSRSDIASYLGLTVETVCRNFSAFQKLGILEVDQRHVRISDLGGLTRISDLDTPKAPRARRRGLPTS